jgi:putative transcriptional regulator
MAVMNLGSNQRISGRSYLDGQCLIAMPGMSDQRFARSVVYLCAHSEDGAMGIIVNKPAADTRFPELLVQLDVIPSDQAIRLPSQAEKMQVLRGGPVETKRGFVLHSADFFLESATLPIDDGICLTATLDILRAIAVGTGPENAVLALGYAGWGAGQLESEIQSNGWLHCAADQALLFDDALDTKYARALGKLGIDQAFLSKDAGHA